MSNPRTLFLQTGRAGDILNTLPLAHRHTLTTGERPLYMVAEAYAGLLDGVSYVEPVIFKGPFENFMAALFQARLLTDKIRVCQIYGRGICNESAESSFARESWVKAAADVPWGSLPLVIDQRNAEREARLCRLLLSAHQGKKIVLAALEGTSSPFPFTQLVLNQLREHLGPEFFVLDVCGIHVERFFDLLGLFETAHCLVTIDTGHLHLAHACPQLPVVSFITRDPAPWHGSPWRPQHIGRFYYDELPRCLPDAIRCVERAPWHIRPKIVHVWADWREGEAGAEVQRRAAVAQASWREEYSTGLWKPWEFTRVAGWRDGKSVGDPHPVPFARDLITWGMMQTDSSSDIIALTNADVGFVPGLTGRILEAIERHGCAFTHRRDFKRLVQPLIRDGAMQHGDFYPGSDAFFFTAKWWAQHGHEYHDFLIGREHWDEVLRQLIKFHGGVGIEHAIWHEWHESFWCGPDRWKLAGNLHNARLKAAWFKRTGFQAEDFRWFKVIEQGHLHP